MVLHDPDVSSPLLLPIHTSEQRSQKRNSHVPPTRRRLWFFGTAIVTGIVFHLVLLGTGATDAMRQRMSMSVGDSIPGTNSSWKSDCPTSTPPKTEAQKLAEEAPWTIDQVREMINHTKGYYCRDYSLALGWNNMRYIIEASLLHARLLNRTLILPSFVYARACEWDFHVCSAFAPLFMRSGALGWETWPNLPEEKERGWRIPLGLMLDLNHLRKTHSVITVAEYLQLNGMSPEIELPSGAWHRKNYQNGENPSIHEIPNNKYDPEPIVRVEMLPSHPPGKEDSDLSKLLFATLGNLTRFMDLERAEYIIKGRVELSGDDQLETVLRENGWEVLYTFRSAANQPFSKNVAEPIKQVAPRSRLRGMVDDYSDVNTDVLVLAGETHDHRKPGDLLFAHPEQRDVFSSTVLRGIRPPGHVRRLAAKLHERMEKRVNGRQWMGAHMRREDFFNYGWVKGESIQDNLRLVKQRLDYGRRILHEIYDTKKIQPYEVPAVEPERDIFDRPPPLDSDPFYIATDERSPDGLDYIQKNGGILISDLLTLEDRQDFGWPILMTDVLAIIEQTTLSHSAYFHGSAMSSFAGGIVNMRAARGADKRTGLLD